jgi:hypothetical protein
VIRITSQIIFSENGLKRGSKSVNILNNLVMIELFEEFMKILVL